MLSQIHEIIPGVISAKDNGDGSFLVDTGSGYRALSDSERIDIAKASKKQSINDECAALIFAKWPVGRQLSCNAGMYLPAVVEQRDADVAAMIEASNTATAAVDAALTVEQVEAVTATWPKI